ncbi:MAG: bifunctional (p)ppGpp synthetase/guanosine-3',5'-bis(diphosphate) 3'-pyrophosphohydrolase [Ardenticatenaceae bacterium]|nr:bifunctional (p)ppGpp synthetase/guanosine-3',5'-bis(diphosphate) 3'-pyrophosphohydrolase [Ardenticatenaceae bacterium]MCB9444591.1 bifunctional (p)ppGpp synthetase/guanosine-3',5'-bis(diphosphate) 3'-pyrophosphohydrolase [Ardenticatenaceae bacterium]
MDYQVTLDGAQFFDQTQTYLSVEDRKRIQNAFTLARREHGEQRRKSGELFFIHPLTVAYYLSQYHLDASALVAALLHDVAEDTRVAIEEIEEEFGSEVAMLVDSVTKLKDVSLGIAQNRRLTRKEIEDASLTKLLSIMTKDVRAVIIKLFDRLHNMRTIEATPYDRQVYKANETLSVYAPLANRLGIWMLKNELEALSLEVLNRKAYYTIKNRLETIHKEHQSAYDIISGQIFNCLLDANLDVRNVILSPENIYTVYQDQIRSGASYRDVDKTMRLVILMADWPSCYQALGHLHQLWKPVPGKFDDYIAVPRDNLYRSLHTTVIHTSGQHLKLRIRTPAMDKVSSVGVLARWLYADTPFWTRSVADRVETFLANISGSIKLEPQNPTAAVKGVVEDVFSKQIRVYTPRGDVLELPQGATPLDFAYGIHTGLGDQCHTAFVNEALHPLNKPLQDGDRVHIVKKLRAQPQRSWLDEDLGYLTTNYARSHARRWFRRLPASTAVAQGRQLLQYELDMIGYPQHSHQNIAATFNLKTTADLYYSLGRAELLPTVVSTRILEDKWNLGPSRTLDHVVYTTKGEKLFITNAHNRKIQLCGTCQPESRDPIIGFLRADGGITVHKEGCRTLRTERLPGRTLKLGWSESSATRQVRLVTIQVEVYDRPGLLFEITHLMQQQEINIAYIHTPPRLQGEMDIILTLEVLSPRQLVRVLHQIHALSNVSAVRCLHQGPPPELNGPPTSLYRPE